MRVTHVITRLIVGGAQENTVATVLGLRRKPDLEVKLISGPTHGPEGSLESAVAQEPGLLTIVPELVRPVHPWKDLVALRKLTRLFREQQPHLVHTHSGKAGILGRLAAAKARVPIIIHHIHGPSFGPFQGAPANFIFRGAERYAARVTTHFICTAHAMTRRYLAAGIGQPEMFTRVLSGFDLQPYEKLSNDPMRRAQLGLPPDAFVIGKIARLFSLKGHDDLFSAFQQLLPQCPHARLLLIGDGPLREQFTTKLSAMGLTDKVVFTGLLPPQEVPRHIAIMDCLAHLSAREALSRALPQALAAGKPVVAYDFDGADEICLEGETGFLIRSGDVAIVADRLLKLSRDAGLRERLGKRGREFVFANFSVERLVNEQHELYLRLARQNHLPVQ
ncbi:MAG: glycosyltransferase family 1 protein [Pedosphaera sp.]|nr:glycosyltransferase family 1 protein [Pedosphaera sp.]